MTNLMTRANFYLPVKMLKRLATLRETTGLSVSELVRRALDEFLLKNKVD